MAARPTRSGYLRLSLVSCPVALFTPTSRTGDVRSNMLHAETGNLIRMAPTDPETGAVERSDIVRGYEIGKGRHVVLTNEEPQAVRLATNRILEIERFVDGDGIDRLYWNDPFFLVPDGEMAVEALALIREAMPGAAWSPTRCAVETR